MFLQTMANHSLTSTWYHCDIYQLVWTKRFKVLLGAIHLLCTGEYSFQTRQRIWNHTKSRLSKLTSALQSTFLACWARDGTPAQKLRQPPNYKDGGYHKDGARFILTFLQTLQWYGDVDTKGDSLQATRRKYWRAIGSIPDCFKSTELPQCLREEI